MSPRRNRRHLGARTLLLAAGLAILVVVGAVSWPYQGFADSAVVIVDQGMSRRAIAERLTERGVLYSPWPFLLYAYLQPSRTLKAGEYAFAEPAGVPAIFDKLTRGQVKLYALTIPEGYTRWDIADEVERLRLASRQAFLEAASNVELVSDLAPEAANLEGYLYPDTYHFARPSDPDAMVRTMVQRFRAVYNELRADAELPRTLTAHEQVTLASLVEKETGVADERGLVAAVFYNRLERRMLLGCDPTVIYAARLASEGQFDGVINVSDLERESPYNTYLRAGLPPGPIASPGRASLEAVLNPPESKYLFFVSNTEGGHFFAATSREHERNVARYRRLRAQQQNQR
jgi:UPF0755 protein